MSDGGEQVFRLKPASFRVGDQSPEPDRTPRAKTPDARERAAAPRRRHVWDLVLAIVLLVVLAGAAALASYLGIFLAFASDSCGTGSCDLEAMSIGIWVAITAPWAVFVIALVVAIVLIVVRRIAFWVPLLGLAMVLGAWNLGAYVVWAATGG